MYKLVVCNFDKTLIDDDLAIPISTVLTIDEIRRKNCKFVIATGRGVNFIKEYIKDVNFIDYIISLNGSYIYDVLREKVIYEKAIKKEYIKKIIDNYKELKIYLSTDHSKCLLNKNIKNDNEIIIRDLNDFLKNNKVYKIEIHTKTIKQSKEIVKEIKKMEFEINLNLNEYENKDYLIEITSYKNSKYNGLMKIAEIEKITKDEIVAFGESYSDIELIKNVSYGIGMENAKKEIKKIAKKITLSNNNKGVEKMLLEIFK